MQKASPSNGTDDGIALLVATRKGGWILKANNGRQEWQLDGPHFLGNIISHLVLDPRDRKTLLAAAKTGHLGPTIFRSTDGGANWEEAKRPPAFPKAKDGETGRIVDHTFWLTPGHASEPGVWYAGTSPQGLFRSEDGGMNWESLEGFNADPKFVAWWGTNQDGTPDGPTLHSVIVDPRDASHLYVGMSGGGVHESRDRGISWSPLVDGLEVVEGLDPVADPSSHDPHCVRLSPAMPDRLYQQNHCGIYRLDRPATRWERVGRAMPEAIGDIGFPMVVHPEDPDTAFVFPMDGTTVWPRTSPQGAPAAYVTRDAGRSWQRLDDGLPRGQAWWTVFRQAMTADAAAPMALYVGNTNGEIWMGEDEGTQWRCIARHLPRVHALEAVRL